MRSLNIFATLAALASFFLCTTGSFAAMNGTTDAGLYHLDLQLEPAHPIVGSNGGIMIVTDARSNRKIDDALIEVIPWMTIHGHGSPKKPSIKKAGDGRYVVSDLFYTMEGDWDLMITIQQNGAKDTAIFTVSNVKKK